MKSNISHTPSMAVLKRSLSALFFVSQIMITVVSAAQETPVMKSAAVLIKPKSAPDYTGVHCMVQDKTGNIWVGTTDAGIYRFNGRTFTHFNEKDGLANAVIFSLMVDNTGRVWAGTNEGAYFYDGHRFHHFTLPGIDDINYNLINVANIVRDWYRYKPVFSIVQDKSGNIWFGTAGAGLYRFDGQQITNFRYVEKTWKAFVPDAYNRINCNIYGNPAQHLFVDSKGDLWFSSFESGRVFRYNGKTIEDMRLENRIKDRVIDLKEDKTGNMWFCTENDGAYRYNGRDIRQFTEKDGLCFKTITCVLPDGKGNIWFGCIYPLNNKKKEGCISRSDGRTFSSFSLKGLGKTAVSSIFEDHEGNIWIGAANMGLYRYDGQKFTDFSSRHK